MTEDEEIIAFHYCLGIAITQWSSVEGTLGDIVKSCYEDESFNSEALAVGFFLWKGFVPS